ncbi:MAG: dTDP-4-dehydrorhamnose reductase [Bacteroidales bacterium]|nr:dTDP-4-dehydrorhamnose reductase [Bacteroidales bacterium]
MNILVTGANGQLGTELRNVSSGSKDHWIFSDVNELPGVETVSLDITNASAVEIICESEKVDLIINCAAYTNVDMAEDDPAMAELLNHTAVKNLSSVAAKRKAALIHISTDYIFNGEAFAPISEDAQPSPLGIYGATKYAGECAIQRSGCKAIILRTAWLYSPYGKNFVKTMRNLTSGRDNIKVVADQVGTPTYARDLAEFIAGIVAKRQLSLTGTYNFTDEGVTSWYDFAVAICRMSGNVCDIRPCTSSEYPTKARRPHYSVLDKSRVKNVFGVSLPWWQDSLRKCIDRIETIERQ